MKTMESLRQFTASGTRPGLLHRILKPQGIEFSGGLDGAVKIAITFRNTSYEPTPAVTARIEAAPLGAFVPGVPIALAKVPALSPGDAWIFRKVVPYSPPTQSRGQRSHAWRQAVLGLGMEDDRSRLKTATDRRASPRQAGGWPLDPLHAFKRGGFHAAGNINVFVGDESVERHMARALRVSPAVVNVAMFVIGSRPDSYHIELQGTGLEWQPTIRNGRFEPITAGPSFDFEGGLMQLAFTPPAGCSTGSLDVLVTQRSSGRTARVEFSFDPEAEGAGCYTI